MNARDLGVLMACTLATSAVAAPRIVTRVGTADDPGVLTIHQQGAAKLSASFEVDGRRLDAEAALSDGLGTAALTLGDGRVVTTQVDYRTGTVTLKSSLQVTKNDILDLARMQVALGTDAEGRIVTFPQGDSRRLLDGVLSIIGMLREGSVIGTMEREFEALKIYGRTPAYSGPRIKTGGTGVKCVSEGYYYAIGWDWRKGPLAKKHTVNMWAPVMPRDYTWEQAEARGGFRCHGLVGPNCNWGKWRWTLDALRHDTCMLQTESAGIVSAGKCGDEFADCWDDALLADADGCHGAPDETWTLDRVAFADWPPPQRAPDADLEKTLAEFEEFSRRRE